MTRRILSAVAFALIATTSCEESPFDVIRSPRSWDRAVTLADWTPSGYGSASGLQAVRDIEATGANTIVFVVTWYQPELESSVPAPDPARTPTFNALASAMAQARSRGLKIVVKPHVDVDTGEWRGKITPERPSTWYAAYSVLVNELAVFSNDQGCYAFVVGTELATLSGDGNRWRDLVAGVRSVFSGQVWYAASWDEAWRVQFWDAVDATGVDAYFPVARRTNAGRLELLSGWQPWLSELKRLHQRTAKPVVITEIGYRSVDGAGGKPYDVNLVGDTDLEEQADLYAAALSAFADQDWVTGLVWWNWLANGQGGPSNRDYTPFGKPAEEVLRDAWR